ncbi:MAG: ABC transporter ATP-binding protein [Nitrospirae bacterium]|nr:ABC transporter ATP-binding protein [Nitrospirota bacterium]
MLYPSDQDLLSINNLSISFTGSGRDILKVVDDVNFSVRNEEVLGLVGESGCGKTLSALSMIRLLPSNTVSSGEVIFRGQNLIDLEEKKLRDIRGKEISMIFQEPMTSLNPVFTVGYQIAEALITHKNMRKKQALDESIELLRAVKIPSPELRVREYPHQMSGGMRQRVMIAMAIACKPSLLIADEPTTALDVTIQAQILELLHGLKEKNRMSILLITHDLGIVAEWVQRVEVMYAGRIVEKADVKELFANPRHPYTIGLFESLPKRKGEKLTPIPGQVPKMHELPDGCKFSTRCRYVIGECRVKEPELLPAGAPDHLSRCIRAMEI